MSNLDIQGRTFQLHTESSTQRSSQMQINIPYVLVCYYLYGALGFDSDEEALTQIPIRCKLGREGKEFRDQGRSKKG